VVVETPGFDFITRLKESLKRENKELQGDDLFSLSPLTSPESSPESTPTSSLRMQTIQLPTEEPMVETDPSNATPTKKRVPERKRGGKLGGVRQRRSYN